MHSLPSRMSLGAAVMLALVIRSSTVDAQPNPDSPNSTAASQLAVVRELTDEANTAHEAKNYETAIKLYLKAYQLVSHPILLFNIGQSFRLSGNHDQAGRFYRRYLKRDPNGPRAPLARKHINSLSASTPTTPSPAAPAAPQQATELAASGSPASPAVGEARVTTPADAEQPRPRIESAIVNEDTSEDPLMTPARAQEKEEVPRATMLRYAGYTLMGFGVLAGAAGFRSIYQESGYVALTIGCVSLGLIGGGVVTYAYSERQRKRRAAKSVAWSPAIGTGFAGIALTGSLP